MPGSGARAKCCTYDFDAAELSQLCSVMDASVDVNAATTAEYHRGAPAFRSSGIAESRCHSVVTLAQHLTWLKTKKLDAIPELKDTQGAGMTVFLESHGKDWIFLADTIAQQVAAAGFTAVWNADSAQRGQRALLQTFDHRVAARWESTQPLSTEYMYSEQMPPDEDCTDTAEYECRNVQHLVGLGVDVISPPIHSLVAASPSGDRSIVPSEGALALQAMGVAIGSWSAERQGCVDDSAPLAVQPAAAGPCGAAGTGGYYAPLEGEATFQHMDVLRVLDTLFRPASQGGVGIVALFADFPATVAAFVNCVAEQ